MTEIVLSIPGAPIVSKNSRMLLNIPTKGGGSRPMSLPSKAARRFMKLAEKSLKQQWGSRPPIAYNVNMAAVFYGTWPDDKATPDLSNLYQGPEDALQHAGILANDNLIKGHDGSRIVRLCAHCPLPGYYVRGKHAGERKAHCGHKKACPYQGAVIKLTPFDIDDLAALARHRCAAPSVEF